MNEEELKKAIRSQRFIPARIQLSNGASFEVRHSDAIAIGQRTCGIVVGPGAQLISNLHVIQVERLMAAE
jgi:hypothetical protein